MSFESCWALGSYFSSKGGYYPKEAETYKQATNKKKKDAHKETKTSFQNFNSLFDRSQWNNYIRQGDLL